MYPKVPSAEHFMPVVFAIFPQTAACGRLLQLCGGEESRTDYFANFTLIGGDKGGKPLRGRAGRRPKRRLFGNFANTPTVRNKNAEKCFTNRVEQSNKIADNAPVKIRF